MSSDPRLSSSNSDGADILIDYLIEDGAIESRDDITSYTYVKSSKKARIDLVMQDKSVRAYVFTSDGDMSVLHISGDTGSMSAHRLRTDELWRKTS